MSGSFPVVNYLNILDYVVDYVACVVDYVGYVVDFFEILNLHTLWQKNNIPFSKGFALCERYNKN